MLRNGELKKFIAETVDADRFARFVLGFVFRQIVKYLGWERVLESLVCSEIVNLDCFSFALTLTENFFLKKKDQCL